MLINKLICFITGHDWKGKAYLKSENDNKLVMKYKCIRCNKKKII